MSAFKVGEFKTDKGPRSVFGDGSGFFWYYAGTKREFIDIEDDDFSDKAEMNREGIK